MRITEIIKEADVEGKFGPQKRTAFKVEGNPNVLSVFSKYSLKVGQEVEGEITATVKDGKTYHNFKFASKAPSSSGFTEFDREMLKGVFNNVNAIRKHLIFGPEPKTEDSDDLNMPF